MGVADGKHGIKDYAGIEPLCWCFLGAADQELVSELHAIAERHSEAACLIAPVREGYLQIAAACSSSIHIWLFSNDNIEQGLTLMSLT